MCPAGGSTRARDAKFHELYARPVDQLGIETRETDITMSYPARSVEEVKVYDVGDTVPNSAVAIGKVAC